MKYIDPTGRDGANANNNPVKYLDARTGRWLSTDPALGEYIPLAPVNHEAKKHNQNLPGMGGIYNSINMHLYHYAGNKLLVQFTILFLNIKK